MKIQSYIHSWLNNFWQKTKQTDLSFLINQRQKAFALLLFSKLNYEVSFSFLEFG